MAFLYLSLAVLLTAFTVLYVPTLFRSKLKPRTSGFFDPRFRQAAEVFRSQIENGDEIGGAVSAYYKGQLVLDLWGGYADVEMERHWKEDTITCIFSISKMVAGIVAARMVEKGHLQYDQPVSKYWPGFGRNGKQNITVEMLLSHQSGLIGLDKQIDLAWIKDDVAKLLENLEEQEPSWPPGTKHGYHTITYGLYVDQLLRMADPTKRNITHLIQAEINGYLGVDDIFLGLSPDIQPRAARSIPAPFRFRPLAVLKMMLSPKYLSLLKEWHLSSSTMVSKWLYVFKDVDAIAFKYVNDPDYSRIPLSSVLAFGTARSLAKLLSIFTTNGLVEGRRLLSENTVTSLMETLVSGESHFFKTDAEFGRGTMMFKNSKGNSVVGHSGNGGQVSFADRENHLSFAYVTNSIQSYLFVDDPRYISLQRAIYDAIDKEN